MLTSTLDIREDYKLSSAFNESSAKSQPLVGSVQANHVLDGYSIDEETRQIPNNGNYDLLSQDISGIYYMANLKNDRFLLSHDVNLHESLITEVDGGESCIGSDYRSSFKSLGSVTKDKTKVRFSALPKTARAVGERQTSATRETKADKKPSPSSNLDHVFEVLSEDVSRLFCTH